MSLPPLGKVAARVRLMVDSRLPVKPVKRTVRGIEMVLPRGHALPYFTHPGSVYFDNLVALAKSLARSEGEVTLLDIGANVGDTALVVLDAAPGRAVCVEPDPHWLDYLQANVGAMANVAVEHSVLVSPETDQTHGLKIARAETRQQHRRAHLGRGRPADDHHDRAAREVPRAWRTSAWSSPTPTGTTSSLVTAVSAAFLVSKPVIFFEFDPVPTRIVNPEVTPSEPVAHAARARLRAGRAVGQRRPAHRHLPDHRVWSSAPPSLERTTKEERGYAFWDVAVAHRDDPVGLQALEDAARVSLIRCWRVTRGSRDRRPGRARPSRRPRSARAGRGPGSPCGPRGSATPPRPRAWRGPWPAGSPARCRPGGWRRLASLRLDTAVGEHASYVRLGVGGDLLEP
ncbi:hypothetical protein G5V59_21605 [Nocardioides sp. W3-2-3]|uniref:hypothetical protein n=1 Tax=Nocardioides convexus TaxID=2712224 RepID=UPI0024182CF1|nr:hypothetical protein [Nocardioides convexus]NHA01515.1 hypothetical protein [Nocardioides convexus]